MAKRMLNPEVVETGKFKRMSLEAQLLYFKACLTQDVDGICDVSAIAYDNRIPDEAVSELEANGFILKVGEDLWAITDWKRHNNIRIEAFHKHRPEVKKISVDENARYFLSDNVSQNFVRDTGEGEVKDKVIPTFSFQEITREENIITETADTVENPVENCGKVETVSSSEPVDIGNDITITEAEYASLKVEIPDFDTIAPEVSRRTARALAKQAYTSIINLVRHIARADGDNIRRYVIGRKKKAETTHQDSFDTEGFWNAALNRSYGGNPPEQTTHYDGGSFDTEDFWNAAVEHAHQQYLEMKEKTAQTGGYGTEVMA